MSMDLEDGGHGDGDRVLVAEFALGLLDANEHRRVGGRIAGEPLLGHEFRLWRLRLGALDREFAEVPAPAGTLQKIEARLFPGVASRRTGIWESLAFWRGLTTVAAALAVVVIGVNWFTPHGTTPSQQMVATLEGAGSNVKFVAFYDQGTGAVRLTGLSGDAVPNKDFELWAINGKNAPVAMGVIPANAKSNFSLDPALKANFGSGTVLAISVEQLGGSPTGAPQGPVVASGQVVPI